MPTSPSSTAARSWTIFFTKRTRTTEGKARFFASLGFSRDDPERLVMALRDIAEHGEVVKSAESVHGEKYVVEGPLPRHTQESRRARVRTVWIIDRGDDAPRLVTAYPRKE